MRDHRFYSTMAIVSAVTILGGFLNTYGPKVASGTPGVPGIIHAHAVVGTAWLAFFVVQTTLVRRGRMAVHRRLGVAGVVLASLMAVVGVAASISAARLGHRGIPGVEFPDAAGFLLLNLGSVAAFSILVAAGWLFRNNPQTHKRLMLMATAGALVGPGVSRLPFFSGNPPAIAALVMAFLFAGPIYDLVTRRRVHPAYIGAVGLVLLPVPPPVVTTVAATGTWQAVAAWLIG
jgi:uncharacterized membrane protein YozB (DUF420 family)